MKLKIRQKISGFLQRLKIKKKQEEASVVVVDVEEDKMIKPSDFPPVEPGDSPQSKIGKEVRSCFIRFEPPIIIKKSRIKIPKNRKVGLKGPTHHEKKWFSDKGPIETEND